MKTFGNKIKSINFKKAFIAFLVCALAFVVVAVSYLAIVYQNQWNAAVKIKNISSDIASGVMTTQDAKGQLTEIAGSLPNIVDIIILDKTGQITYSANNSLFAQSSTIDFDKRQIDSSRGREYLMERNGVGERAVNRRFSGRSSFGFRGQRTGTGYFTDGYIVQSVTDNATGEQILFISNPHALWNSQSLASFRVIGIIGFLYYAVFKLLLCLWVYADSKKHGKTTILWTVLIFLTGLIGWVIYLIARGNTQKCDKCGTVQGASNQFV